MNNYKVWQKFWLDNLNLTEAEEKLIYDENEMAAYMPYEINDRGIDAEKYQSPIIVIVLPRKSKKPDTLVLIDEFCRLCNDGKKERFEKLQFFDVLDKILNHHLKLIEKLSNDCENISVEKYFMSLFYHGKHYVIPLSTHQKDEKHLTENATQTAKVVFGDLLNWVKMNKDQLDLDDIDNPIAKYKEKNGLNVNVFD